MVFLKYPVIISIHCVVSTPNSENETEVYPILHFLKQIICTKLKVPLFHVSDTFMSQWYIIDFFFAEVKMQM